MIAGQAVSVREPHRDWSGEWLLPAEVAYVLEVRDDQARLRCPATGTDCWIDVALLVQTRVQRLEALADAVRAGLGGLPDHPWIPGVAAGPVRDALFALDGELPGNSVRDVPIG